MPGMMDGMGFGMMLLGWLFWLGLLIILVLAVAWAIGSARRPRRDAAERDRAIAILRERYARGELSKEEYEQRKRDLAA